MANGRGLGLLVWRGCLNWPSNSAGQAVWSYNAENDGNSAAFARVRASCSSFSLVTSHRPTAQVWLASAQRSRRTEPEPEPGLCSVAGLVGPFSGRACKARRAASLKSRPSANHDESTVRVPRSMARILQSEECTSGAAVLAAGLDMTCSISTKPSSCRRTFFQPPNTRGEAI